MYVCVLLIMRLFPCVCVKRTYGCVHVCVCLCSERPLPKHIYIYNYRSKLKKCSVTIQRTLMSIYLHMCMLEMFGGDGMIRYIQHPIE